MNRGFFAGNVARTPIKRGTDDQPVCYFTLIDTEYVGANRPEKKIAIPFTIFGAQAEALFKHVMEGDGLMVEYHVANNDRPTEGGMEYGFSFIVDEFKFGAPGKAKREKLAQAKG